MLSQCLIISLGLILVRRIPKGISDFYHNKNTGRNGSLPTLGAWRVLSDHLDGS